MKKLLTWVDKNFDFYWIAYMFCLLGGTFFLPNFAEGPTTSTYVFSTFAVVFMIPMVIIWWKRMDK